MAHQHVFATRLKQARLKANLSQKQLGILAGMDQFSASARMNHYEKGRHVPELDMAKQLADILKVPMAYLFCPEDDIADLLMKMGGLSEVERKNIIKANDLPEAEA